MTLLFACSPLEVPETIVNHTRQPTRPCHMAPFDALPAPFDQYEVGVPLAAAGRCARRLLSYLQATSVGATPAAGGRAGFFSPVLVRFVGEAPGQQLSPSTLSSMCTSATLIMYVAFDPA